ncbi:MAG: OmpA family protein [Treponema sp.]
MNNRLCIMSLLMCLATFAHSYTLSMDAQTVQNWETAHIDSKITVDMHKSGLHLPVDRNAAFQLIEQNRFSLLKNVYLSVLVDSSHRVGNYLAEGKIGITDINYVINSGKSTSPILSQQLQQVIVYHQNPLQHIARLFIKHNAPYNPSYFPVGAASKVYTGILIDARGKLPVHGEYTDEKLNPCLFPKIWTKDMSLIYEKNIVAPSIALEKSIVFYTGDTDENLYRDRIGTQPLRIIARGVFGDNRTDPIISNADAERILAKEENIKLLREGKIVILCDKENLQFSKPYPFEDENFYFTYQDIATVFLDHQPEKISVKNKDNVVKITMYDVRFVADSPEILPEEKSSIDAIAEALKKVGAKTHFLIEGHTADLNRPESEKILSQQRADAIAEELAKRGIERERMETAGYGASRPLAPSNSQENKARNRRVEITILRN